MDHLFVLSLDPIWTVKTGSLCLLSATPEEFFNATSGLNFIVKDYDAASKDDTLGTVNIEQQEILKVSPPCWSVVASKDMLLTSAY